MKNAWMLLLVMLSLSLVTPDTCQAQILKGFGKKVENKLKNKVEEKAERHVDKTINTVDRKSDESIEEAVKGDGNKTKTNKKETSKQSKNVKQNSKALDQNIPVRKDQAMTMFKSSACNDFLWFKKGSIFEYDFDGVGYEENLNSQIRVKEVSHRDGKAISEIAASQPTNNGTMEFTLHYICDGNNLYVDMSAMTEQIMQQINTEGGEHNTQIKEAIDTAEFDMSEGFTAIPKVLYPGLRLPDASFSFSMNMSGMDMQMNSEVTDRVVVAKESLTTKAGTFECMKIRSTTSINMNMMGRAINTGTSTDYVWMAPEIGVVKQETHTNNKVTYSMTLSKLQR